MKLRTQCILKLIILIILTLFTLFNYRFISLDKGISKTNIEDMSIEEFLSTATNITGIEYYQRPFMDGEPPSDIAPRPSNLQYYDYMYRIYIVTNDDAYLIKATKYDIKAMQTLGLFSQTLKPNKINPIPYYVEIIIGFLVLIIPFGHAKKKSTVTN